VDKKKVLDSYLGKYRITELYRWDIGEGTREEKKAKPGKHLGYIVIAPRQLTIRSETYPINKFRPNRSAWDAYLVVEGLPEFSRCELKLRGPGKALLLIYGSDLQARYVLEYNARRKAEKLAAAEYAELVVDPAEVVHDPGRLPEYRVRLVRVRAGERAVSEKYPGNLGLRTKLGGKPDFIQEQNLPKCKRCGHPMTFVAQIDSIDHVTKPTRSSKRADARANRVWMFMDVGMIYVYYCFDCGESYSFTQSY
jgi:hypothetical protein